MIAREDEKVGLGANDGMAAGRTFLRGESSARNGSPSVEELVQVHSRQTHRGLDEMIPEMSIDAGSPALNVSRCFGHYLVQSFAVRQGDQSGGLQVANLARA